MIMTLQESPERKRMHYKKEDKEFLVILHLNSYINDNLFVLLIGYNRYLMFFIIFIYVKLYLIFANFYVF